MDMETARLAAEVIGLAGVIGGSAFAIIKALNQIRGGMKCMLRCDMMRTYYANHDKNEIRDYEAENFEKEYAAYKALGGNSFIDNIHEAVKEWEVVR